MQNYHGFTLIELIISMAIIGILASIGVSAFSLYRERGHDAHASQDLRSAATAQEAQYVDTATYIACTDREDCASKLIGVAKFSDETEISMTADLGNSFEGTAASNLGSGRTYTWNNTTGLQENNN